MRFWQRRPVPGSPLVSVCVATYRQGACLEALLASLRAQTYSHLEVLVWHDGPAAAPAREAFERGSAGDARFRWHATRVRGNKFGHDLREQMRQRAQGAAVTFTNGDNYYAPVWAEALASALFAPPGADLAYCDCVHSHRQWQPLPARLQRGHIDVGSWMARADLVRRHAWEDFSFAGDWHYLSRLLGPATRTQRVAGALFVHN